MSEPQRFCHKESEDYSGEHMITSEVARMAGVSPQAIRTARAEGRIKAAHTTETGYRFYHRSEAVRFTAARQLYYKIMGSAGNVWKVKE